MIKKYIFDIQLKILKMKPILRTITLLTAFVLFINCNHSSRSTVNEAIMNSKGKTIEQRFNAPEGFTRVSADKNSFGEYLRNLPLKPHLSKVYLYNGNEKNRQDVHEAVIDMELSKVDLQQCADAVIRLRAEFLFLNKRYEDIHFNFTNGFNAAYIKWRNGFRIKVIGNNVSWVKQTKLDTTHFVFRQYLDKVFSYAGTRSLSKELTTVKNFSDLKIGDVFIQGGSPGHAVIVVDMALDKKTGRKVYMIAQSYMPAQQTHILKNFNNPEISPWYYLDSLKPINTPEWDFETKDLKRFID